MPFNFTGQPPSPKDVHGTFAPIARQSGGQQRPLTQRSGPILPNIGIATRPLLRPVSWSSPVAPNLHYGEADINITRTLFLGTAKVLHREDAKLKAVKNGQYVRKVHGLEQVEDTPCDCAKDFSQRKDQDQQLFTGGTLKSLQFIFFERLPAELRNQVYSRYLDVGPISLRTCVHHIPNIIVSRYDTTALLVSRQFAEEAKMMLYNNRIIIVNISLESMSRRIIADTLPSHVWKHVKNLTLVIDFTRACFYNDSSGGARLDWRPLQAMTRLRHLRIAGIAARTGLTLGTRNAANLFDPVMRAILERVPCVCVLECGVTDVEEQAHVLDMAGRIQRYAPTKRRWGNVHEVLEIPRERLEVALRQAQEHVVKGSKNASTQNFRFT